MRRGFGLAVTAALAMSPWCLLSCGSSGRGASTTDGGVDASTFDGGGDHGGDAVEDAAGDVEGGKCGNLPARTVVSHTSSSLAIAADPGAPGGGTSFGIYDPSIVYPPGAPGGALSYSTTSSDDVHTRIAVSTDQGKTFTYVAEPNTVTPATVTTTDTSVCGASTCPCVLWHEVSSLVADPTDPDPGAAFKLFVHTYASLAGGTNLRRDWGYIGLYTAPKADGPWSAGKPLLGWKSSGDVSTMGVAQVLSSTPALADCIAFTEPGAVTSPLGVDLALTCISLSGGQTSNRIVLLRSKDHAASFTYVTTMLTGVDSACLGSPVSQVQGADLFFVAGTEYLTVTPIAPIAPSGSDGYAGCVTIPIADVAAGSVARTDGGAPQVVRWIVSDDNRFTGPCTYAEGATASGYFVPMQSQPPPPMFHIFPSGIAAP